REIDRLLRDNIRPLAIVGIAGTTETGNVDPLNDLADIAAEVGCHFHVDAAWGGPTLFSRRHRHLLAGIERADSVTLDAHKQLYVPMGAGMVLFRDPASLRAIEHHATYILREGSKDLGSHTLEGSRPGKSMLVHAGLCIMGRKGYELLIDMGIERARQFAGLIRQHQDFELMTEPELNIFTYRYVPHWAAAALADAEAKVRIEANRVLDELTRQIQKRQREAGKTFVSRTTLQAPRYNRQMVTVFRVVLANPLTTEEILQDILKEQVALADHPEVRPLQQRLAEVLGVVAPAM
ncbi:MAG: putative pyridoxal-dependent aspartate 1-decarboxylase, partial [Deltaproteobacteria bacterium]